MTAKKDAKAFMGWLTRNGAEIIEPTNEWELVRFRCDRGVGVIYTNKGGKQTCVGPAEELLNIFKHGGNVRLMPRQERGRYRDKRLPTLIERDGDQCWYGCGKAMTTETATIEHLCSRTHGGPDHIANIVLSCEPCNLAAGHLSVAEKVLIKIGNERAGCACHEGIDA